LRSYSGVARIEGRIIARVNVDQALVERVVLGTADFRDDRATVAVLERYREAGGRKLDLANVYEDGESARAVGSWLRARSGPREVDLYAKGCHPPFCDPALVPQEVDLARSLLGVDVLDVFALHRDDPSIPVERWGEALLGEVDRGSIGSFGVSNWTFARFTELRSALGAEAARLTVFSNHFSLAEMVTPLWPGCLATSKAEIAALARTGTTALAWAAIAGGYFAGHDRRSWASEENDRRRRRATVLARRLGATPSAIALAYVLGQPEHVLAAVGTRSVEHLDELLAAAAIHLGADDPRWLEAA
jgi:aryl-alcohol dehydrogenase-like predicted oxidoreductase